MLKKLGISAIAALMTLGTLSITEAAPSDDNSQRAYYGCGGCYNQNYNDENCDNGNCYSRGNGYGCGGGRGCW